MADIEYERPVLVATTLRIPADIYTYATRESVVESRETGRNVTTADILRDLMRSGMAARVAASDDVA